jgi:hypothetical protein
MHHSYNNLSTICISMQLHAKFSQKVQNVMFVHAAMELSWVTSSETLVWATRGGGVVTVGRARREIGVAVQEGSIQPGETCIQIGVAVQEGSIQPGETCGMQQLQ